MHDYKTIYKYTLPLADATVLQMPDGAKVLSVQIQARQICLWAMVDPSHPLVGRSFSIRGTGQPILWDNDTYIGTVQLDGFVWHIFEVQL